MSRMQIFPRRLAWLRDQLDAWQADGLVTGEQARSIAGRYEPDARASIAALVYVLGALFLGVVQSSYLCYKFDVFCICNPTIS